MGLGVVAAAAGVVATVTQGRRGGPDELDVPFDRMAGHRWPCASCELIARQRCEVAGRQRREAIDRLRPAESGPSSAS